MNQLPRILVAGIGNIFLGDDAFGVEVVQRMLREAPLEGVRIIDFGIRGMDLTYALLEDYDAAILVDAVPRGEAPGTLYVIEPDHAAIVDAVDQEPGEMLIDAHSMEPAKVLRLVAAMGGRLKHVLVLGCEPTPFDPETDMEIVMSEAVRAAVPEAIAMIRSLVAKFQQQAMNSELSITGVDHGTLIPLA